MRDVEFESECHWHHMTRFEVFRLRFWKIIFPLLSMSLADSVQKEKFDRVNFLRSVFSCATDFCSVVILTLLPLN